MRDHELQGRRRAAARNERRKRRSKRFATFSKISAGAGSVVVLGALHRAGGQNAGVEAAADHHRRAALLAER